MFWGCCCCCWCMPLQCRLSKQTLFYRVHVFLLRGYKCHVQISTVQMSNRNNKGNWHAHIHTEKTKLQSVRLLSFFLQGVKKNAIAVPFDRCHCRAKLRWCCLCFLLTVFAGLAAGKRKKQYEPALCWRGEVKAEKREEKASKAKQI